MYQAAKRSATKRWHCRNKREPRFPYTALPDCMGVAPKGESKGKKVYIITNDGCKKIDAYEAVKTQLYTRIAAVSGVIAAVGTIIGLFLH